MLAHVVGTPTKPSSGRERHVGIFHLLFRRNNVQPLQRQLNEEEARDLLRNASRLDVLHERTQSLDDVRQAALQAGISEYALERAVLLAATPKPRPARNEQPLWRRVLKVATSSLKLNAIMVALGVWAGISGGSEIHIAVVAWVAITAFRFENHRREHTPGALQVEVGSMTIALLSSYYFASPSFGTDVAAAIIFTGLALGTVGAAALSILPAHRERSHD